MSYGVSAALQGAVYQKLAADTTLGALVGAAIYDRAPSGALPPTYVSLGPEDVRNRADKDGYGALHMFTVSVVTEAAGFQSAKEVAAAISDCLVDADLTLSRGRLVYLNFDRAVARRVGKGETRRIDLKFRARVEDN
ncbi:DUF3168 domain-containing protein [Halocynthiibacter sp. C4]|uniref:DUF3168 domain-containing protein n=1 Tax=Halocynthiibacter sp. C4 TaxID=2992758 RepID=UPI00237A21DC|nr:DUF3168 domain-containing protein [Halocynthiibacter sp. C4]MDE0589881.1 DUF3168 domain-containing protein [Halocynthiibacter sp. C4]